MVTYKKPFVLASAFFTTATFFLLQNDISDVSEEAYDPGLFISGYKDSDIQGWWEKRLKLRPNMSELGKLLFLDEKPENYGAQETRKRFKILVWKYGSTIENRHLKNFGTEKVDPFADCSVKNCDISYKDDDVRDADLVLFHLHRIKGLKDLPQQKRNLNQIWAFLTDESPYNTFLHRKNKLKDFNGIFNWSMTYRMDSDIPVPYGRTVLRDSPRAVEQTIKLNKRKDVLVAIMGSNCGGQNNRWDYVEKLKQHIPVHVYGKCGPFDTCPGHFASDCKDIDNYLFYLAFENSNCDEYITEKLWWNAFEKNSIPIVMGSDPDTYSRLLPLGSYLNIDDFADPHSLARYLATLNQTGDYQQLYQWKKNFQVLNEHGYFRSKSVHYCRACEALNYNKKARKIYNNLETFWSSEKNCHPPWNA